MFEKYKNKEKEKCGCKSCRKERVKDIVAYVERKFPFMMGVYS